LDAIVRVVAAAAIEVIGMRMTTEHGGKMAGGTRSAREDVTKMGGRTKSGRCRLGRGFYEHWRMRLNGTVLRLTFVRTATIMIPEIVIATGDAPNRWCVCSLFGEYVMLCGKWIVM
jgi:hypothetical protein